MKGGEDGGRGMKERGRWRERYEGEGKRYGMEVWRGRDVREGKRKKREGRGGRQKRVTVWLVYEG